MNEAIIALSTLFGGGGIIYAFIRVWRSVVSPALEEGRKVAERYADVSDRLDQSLVRERMCQQVVTALIVTLEAQGIKVPDHLKRQLERLEGAVNERRSPPGP